MIACVIDPSTVLAFLFQKRGEDIASDWLDLGAAFVTANAQEVIAKLVDRAVCDGTNADKTLDMAVANFESLVLDVVDLTLDDAVQAGA